MKDGRRTEGGKKEVAEGEACIEEREDQLAPEGELNRPLLAFIPASPYSFLASPLSAIS